MYKLKYFLWLIVLCITTTIHANDLCEGATPLIFNTPVNGSTISAETEWANSCNYNKSSVWYKFMTTQAGDYNIKINEIIDESSELLSLYNDVLTLYSGDCTNGFDGLTEIMCVNDDEFGFAGEHLYVNLEASTTYYIMVSSADCLFGKTEGEFSIEVKKGSKQVITNEECTGAILINENSCITGSNINASKANPKPSCNAHIGASVWYKIENLADPVMSLSAAPNFSEIITVYRSLIDPNSGQDLCGDLLEIACNIDGEGNSDELIINNLQSDQIYFIQITGTFASIDAAFNEDTCNDNIPYVTLSTTNITCPATGETCNDNNPNTINDTWDGNCNCISTCANATGTICDDGNPNTIDDKWDANCQCGTCHLNDEDCPDSHVNANCECECTLTINDCDDGKYLDDNCACVPCGQVGDECDDGYYYTTNDTWTQWCTCVGELPDFCPADLIIKDNDVSDQGYFQTSNSIITDGSVVVEKLEQFALNAKKYVTLKPGFNAKVESNFRAYIEGCEFDLKLDESTLTSVKHYPNPFRSEVTLEFQLDFNADAEIIISDVNGRKVTQLQVNNLTRGTQTHSISTQNWIPGIYFYQVQFKEKNTGILGRANGTLVKM